MDRATVIKKQARLRNRTLVIATLMFIIGLAFSACSDPEEWPRSAPETDEGGVEALFVLPEPDTSPSFGAIPFPNDLGLHHNGGIEFNDMGLAIPMNTRVIERALSTMDGFGTASAIYFPLGGTVHMDSLPEDPEASTREGSSAFLLDAQPGSARFGERHPIEVGFINETDTLVLLPQPGRPLNESTRYVAVVTKAVTGETGRLRASKDFQAIYGSGDATNPQLERARELYAECLDLVVGQPDVESLDDIAVATVFTTQAVTGDLLTIHEIVEGLDPPQASFAEYVYAGQETLDRLLGDPDEHLPGWDNPGGIAHDRIGLVAIGRYPSPKFQSPDLGGLKGLLSPDDDRFVRGGDGRPLLQVMEEIDFTIAVPEQPPAGPSGYPVIIYQHGFGGSMASIFNVVNEMAGAGYVTVAIDAVGHGNRYGECSPDFHSNFDHGTIEPDGFADWESDLWKSLGFFKGFLNILAIRDNFRQTVVDQLQLVRLLTNPDLDLSAIGSPPIDTDSIYYLGESLGGIMGSLFLSLEPRVEIGALNVAGGILAGSLLVNSAAIGSDNHGLLKALFGLNPDLVFDRFDPYINLAQMIIDPGDSVNYVGHIIHDPLVGPEGPMPPKNVLQIEVILDEWVPNPSNEALAAAMGIELLEPLYQEIELLGTVPSPASLNIHTQGGSVTGVLVQYNPATHGDNMNRQYGTRKFVPGFPFPGPEPFPRLLNPVTLRSPNREVIDQVIHFFDSYRTTGVAEVVSTAPPVPDYDGDGVLDHEDDSDEDGFSDAAEIAAGTDPTDPAGVPQ